MQHRKTRNILTLPFYTNQSGWMPGYLVMNMTGPKKYRGKNANHFSPSAVFFKPEEYWLIVQTNVAFTLAVALFAFCIYTYGTNSLTLLPHCTASIDLSHQTVAVSYTTPLPHSILQVSPLLRRTT